MSAIKTKTRVPLILRLLALIVLLPMVLVFLFLQLNLGLDLSSNRQASVFTAVGVTKPLIKNEQLWVTGFTAAPGIEIDNWSKAPLTIATKEGQKLFSVVYQPEITLTLYQAASNTPLERVISQADFVYFTYAQGEWTEQTAPWGSLSSAQKREELLSQAEYLLFVPRGVSHSRTSVSNPSVTETAQTISLYANPRHSISPSAFLWTKNIYNWYLRVEQKNFQKLLKLITVYNPPALAIFPL